MILIKNLFFLFTITIFAATSTILNIFNYNPFTAKPSIFINFYVSLCIALAGIIAIIIYYARVKFGKNETIFRFFWPSVRQGLFVSAGITTLLVLRGLRILDWLIGISMIVVVILLELFFQTKKGGTK